MRKENLKRKGVDDGDNSGEENEETTVPAGGGEGAETVDLAGDDSADAGADSPSLDGAAKDDEEDGGKAAATTAAAATEENGDSKEATSDNEQFEDAETGDKAAKSNGGGQESTEEEIVGEGDKKVSRGRGKPPKKAITQEAANGDGDGDKEKENGGGKTSDDEEGEGEEDEDEEEEAEGKEDDDSDYGSSKPKKAKKVAAGKRGAKKKAGRKPAAPKAKGRPGRKAKKQESEDEEEEEEEEEEYEVQDIIDHRKERGGKILYRIRWKNYGAADDTWEPEATLSCPDIIKRYKAKCEKDDEAPPAKKGKTPTKAGAKKGGPGRKPAAAAGGRGRGRPGAKKAKYEEDEEEDDDEEETVAEYEVERIIDVHFKRNGAREYLVRWKGFGAKDDTWEPADNLSCPDLIEKFNEKLDKTKSTGAKELRVNRKHTERLTLVERGRKTSRRNANKGRVSYYDGE
uniref:Putative non-transporter abc protein n=1 Tax=Culex tarsalis TaxID=7177 RepID=A0A1Q3F2Z6_CULTA